MKIKKPFIIGLAGPQTVGKTTTALAMKGVLESEYTGINASVFSYAYPLKKSLSIATGLPLNYFTDQKLKNTYVPIIKTTPRKLMQLYGTEFFRNTISDSFWVDRMEVSICNCTSDYIIIDDIRFDDEAEFVRKKQGIVFELRRNDIAYTKEHKSENGIHLEPIDIIYWLNTNPNSAAVDMLSIIDIISKH